MRRFYTEHPDNPPKWYWEGGLHDACIIGVDTYEFPFDYNAYSGTKGKCDYNALVLKIDAEGALYDNRVQEIRLYNYKILSGGIDIATLKRISESKAWWLADKLTENSGRYGLDVLLEICIPHQREYHLKLSFDRAEVYRK